MLSVTVNTRLPAATSSATVTSATDRLATSLSIMLIEAATPLTLISPSPEVTVPNVSCSVSLPSSKTSSIVGTLICALVVFAGIVTVPDSAVKSSPLAELPAIV